MKEKSFLQQIKDKLKADGNNNTITVTPLQESKTMLLKDNEGNRIAIGFEVLERLIPVFKAHIDASK